MSCNQALLIVASTRARTIISAAPLEGSHLGPGAATLTRAVRVSLLGFRFDCRGNADVILSSKWPPRVSTVAAVKARIQCTTARQTFPSTSALPVDTSRPVVAPRELSHHVRQ